VILAGRGGPALLVQLLHRAHVGQIVVILAGRGGPALPAPADTISV